MSEYLTDAGHAVMRMPMGTMCAVHVHRTWVPMEVHHVWPKGLGGPDIAANKVKLCANAHYSVHSFIDLLIKNNGRVPSETARHYSAKVKSFAMQGWTEAGRPMHGGGE
jgi:hypothetical protein